MPAALDLIIQQYSPPAWKRGADPAGRDVLATGFAALDQLLPGGGWPRGALTEILVDGGGAGELGLLLPALAGADKGVALVAPPLLPFAPALAAAGIDLEPVWLVQPVADKHRLWTVDQLLRSAAFGVVVGWADAMDHHQSRRLQLAAEQGGAVAFVVRDRAFQSHISAASVRVSIQLSATHMTLDLFKCRGRLRPAQLRLDRPPALCGPHHLPYSDRSAETDR